MVSNKLEQCWIREWVWALLWDFPVSLTRACRSHEEGPSDQVPSAAPPRSLSCIYNQLKTSFLIFKIKLPLFYLCVWAGGEEVRGQPLRGGALLLPCGSRVFKWPQVISAFTCYVSSSLSKYVLGVLTSIHPSLESWKTLRMIDIFIFEICPEWVHCFLTSHHDILNTRPLLRSQHSLSEGPTSRPRWVLFNQLSPVQM